jgi:hypothetical protein
MWEFFLPGIWIVIISKYPLTIQKPNGSLENAAYRKTQGKVDISNTVRGWSPLGDSVRFDILVLA